jgi:hypothetical protein
MACRVARTSEWTTRILHELIGKPGCFVTLTYNNDHLPADGGLVKADLQMFIKRLRKFLGDTKIKYYACGEYGEKTNRPHYHLLIIGWMPELQRLYRPDKNHCVSRDIELLWRLGNNTTGNPDREAIQYVVGYIRKKLNGSMFLNKFGNIQEPFQLQSQGIGKDYAIAHKDTILSDKGITRNGHNVGLPRYYRKKLIDKDSEDELLYYQKCEQKRQEKIAEYDDYYEYTIARQSDEERRSKQLRAAEKMYNQSNRL